MREKLLKKDTREPPINESIETKVEREFYTENP